MAVESETRATLLRQAPEPAADFAEVMGEYWDHMRERRVVSAMPERQALADMGLTWVAHNPTVGTFPQYALTTAFNDTTGAMFALFNPEPAGGRNLYLDLIQLMLGGTAPTATVSMEWLFKVDSKDRTPTAGNAAVTPVLTNARKSVVQVPVLQAFSAAGLTVPASGPNARTVARARVNTSLGIVGDEYLVKFGSDPPKPLPGLTAARAAAVGRFVGYAPAFPIPPQHWCVAYMWWLTAATTAPSFEYQLSGFYW